MQSFQFEDAVTASLLFSQFQLPRGVAVKSATLVLFHYEDGVLGGNKFSLHDKKITYHGKQGFHSKIHRKIDS